MCLNTAQSETENQILHPCELFWWLTDLIFLVSIFPTIHIPHPLSCTKYFKLLVKVSTCLWVKKERHVYQESLQQFSSAKCIKCIKFLK